MQNYEHLNSSFNAVSKTLFGSEIGELREFEGYLKELMFPCRMAKSSASGKDVFVSSHLYPEGARFVSQDELDGLEFEPLGINEIKDVDSLFEAVRERALYCGNKVFGKNQNVEIADNCTESSNILYSHNTYKVKNAAYCSQVREAEYIFGVSAFPKTRYSMRCMEGINAVRSFETYYATNMSDTYYSFNCSGCSNCIFAFNLRAKSNVIGNLQLTRERYSSLKEKLLPEMAEELRKRKRLPSIVGLAYCGRRKEDAESEAEMKYGEPPPLVEKAFGTATGLLLGKGYRDLRRFGPWLMKHALKVKKVRGAFGTPTYKVGLPLIKDLPSDRLVTMEEAAKCASKAIEMKSGETPSFDELFKRASQIAYFTFEFRDGHAENAVDVSATFNANNVYAFWDATDSALSAYSSGVIKSKYIFGGYLRILQCHTCINAYDSTDLSRCFEVDSSYKSGDSYFCHNCENVSDSMFCFNAKNLKYAVGNTEVGKEEYLRMKGMLLDYINGKLEKENSLDIDIFSIGKTGK